MHNSLHVFCRQHRVFALDILLDIKKPYPLISATQGNGGYVLPENFSPE